MNKEQGDFKDNRFNRGETDQSSNVDAVKIAEFYLNSLHLTEYRKRAPKDVIDFLERKTVKRLSLVEKCKYWALNEKTQIRNKTLNALREIEIECGCSVDYFLFHNIKIIELGCERMLYFFTLRELRKSVFEYDNYRNDSLHPYEHDFILENINKMKEITKAIRLIDAELDKAIVRFPSKYKGSDVGGILLDNYPVSEQEQIFQENVRMGIMSISTDIAFALHNTLFEEEVNYLARRVEDFSTEISWQVYNK